jgi:hypothetical protein
MTVHVGEIHTDVVPAPAGTGDGRSDRGGGSPRLGAAQDAWRQLKWELGRDRCRTESEGFDD